MAEIMEVPLSDAGVVVLRGLKGPLAAHNDLMSRVFELIKSEGSEHIADGAQQYRVKVEMRKSRGQRRVVWWSW
jgi:hypothetical protein